MFEEVTAFGDSVKQPDITGRQLFAVLFARALILAILASIAAAGLSSKLDFTAMLVFPLLFAALGASAITTYLALRHGVDVERRLTRIRGLEVLFSLGMFLLLFVVIPQVPGLVYPTLTPAPETAMPPEATATSGMASSQEPVQITPEGTRVLDLSPEELEAISELVRNRGRFLTWEDLQSLPLSPTQLSQLASYLDQVIIESGLMTELELYPILTRVAMEQIAANQLTREAACYVEPLPIYTSVAIRKLPRVESGNVIIYIKPGQQFLVVGHDGGEPNVTRWWQVEIPASGPSTQPEYGYIHSSTVAEVGNDACYRMSPVGQ